ncbi:universal stress protein [Streptomyces sp. ISL-66]|uniref:universal stress protein n=1 Tax=Streptomyces sp. ISL-66 TaxID=2819186 RepID=UPI001BE73079|nr:universal stress protein [Streptomyces sp. ISL-66]MBT2467883.1 universal stress protein [Streptomyces sp. ISL-66]
MVLGSRGCGGFAGLLLVSNGLARASPAAWPVVVVPAAEPPSHDPYGSYSASTPRPPTNDTTHSASRGPARRGAHLRVVVAHARPSRPLTTAGTLGPAAHEETAAAHAVSAPAAAHLSPHAGRSPEVEVEGGGGAAVGPGDAAGRLITASRARAPHRPPPQAPARPPGPRLDSTRLDSVTNAVLLHTARPVAVVPPGGGRRTPGDPRDEARAGYPATAAPLT